MRRVLWEVPGLHLSLPGFGVALALACIAALAITVWRARRLGIPDDSVFGLAAWLMTGGFVGARILYLVAHPEALTSWSEAMRFWQGGIVYYGCLIGGLFGSVLYWRRNPFPFLAMADAVAPALALGSAIGRIGCWLNGCCFGAVHFGPLGVRFPVETLPWAHHVGMGWISETSAQSLPVLPAQIMASLDGWFLLVLLTLYFPLRRRDGEVMALLMVTYPVARFFVEALRDDESARYVGMSLSQVISLVAFSAGVATWIWLGRQPVASVDEETGRRVFTRPARSIQASR